MLLAAIYATKTFYLEAAKEWKIPYQAADRQDLSNLYLEPDAGFKAQRPTYDGIPSHLHTGVDLQLKSPGGPGEPIYAIAKGQVVQIADPPPLRRIVIRHRLPNGRSVWSVYLHIIGEKVAVGDWVTPETIIARRMNNAELDFMGWEYNHLHLEIMKSPPFRVNDTFKRKTYICRTEAEVDKYFIDPIKFLKQQMRKTQKFKN